MRKILIMMLFFLLPFACSCDFNSNDNELSDPSILSLHYTIYNSKKDVGLKPGDFILGSIGCSSTGYKVIDGVNHYIYLDVYYRFTIDEIRDLKIINDNDLNNLDMSNKLWTVTFLVISDELKVLICKGTAYNNYYLFDPIFDLDYDALFFKYSEEYGIDIKNDLINKNNTLLNALGTDQVRKQPIEYMKELEYYGLVFFHKPNDYIEFEEDTIYSTGYFYLDPPTNNYSFVYDINEYIASSKSMPLYCYQINVSKND